MVPELGVDEAKKHHRVIGKFLIHGHWDSFPGALDSVQPIVEHKNNPQSGLFVVFEAPIAERSIS